MVQDRQYIGHLWRYECRACGRWFTDRSGTFLEHSKVRLPVWIYFLHGRRSALMLSPLAV